jgi:hypothetical protein
MLTDMVRDYQFVKVYGKIDDSISPGKALTDLSLGLKSVDRNAKEFPLVFVSVVGVQVLGKCIKYGQSVLVLLPKDGSKKAEGCGWDKETDILEWSIPSDSTIVGLTTTVGDATELLSDPPNAEFFAECVSVTINDGKACLNVPYAGSVCINVPGVPNGTVAEACIDVCKKWGIPCGAKVYIKVLGLQVAEQGFGCC